MWNQKDLYSFFLVLMVGRVICQPVNNNQGNITCKFPPELLSLVSISQVDETLKYCLNVNSDDEDNSYCQEIAIFVKDLNNCSIGEVWKKQELRNELISESKKIPLNVNNDICWNFRNLKKYIDFAGMDANSLGSQFTTNKDVCDMFCDRSDYLENCKLLLNLYWIKGILRHTNIEIGKKEISPNSSPQSTLYESATDKSTLESDSDQPKKTNDITGNKSQNANKTVPNKAINDVKPVGQVEKDPPTQSEKINKTVVKASNNQTQSPSNKIMPEEQNKMATVKIDANAKDENLIQPSPVISAEKVAGQTTEDNSKTSASNIKNDTPDTKDISKPTKKITNLSLPESLPKPIDKSLPETENDFNQDTEKNEEAEFGKQVNKFGDEFSDPGSDYGEDEPPPDSTFNVEKDETQKKQFEVPVNTGANMKPIFPEEEDSHFFAYFLTIVVLCIAGYLVFHNKQKIIALIIEGRHERRRRPNGGGYKRLDNKESAKATSQVIF